jgi:hypothetical protein
MHKVAAEGSFNLIDDIVRLKFCTFLFFFTDAQEPINHFVVESCLLRYFHLLELLSEIFARIAHLIHDIFLQLFLRRQFNLLLLYPDLELLFVPQKCVIVYLFDVFLVQRETSFSCDLVVP